MKTLSPFESKKTQINSKDVKQSRQNIMKEAMISDVFLAGTNVITQDGRLVNMDAAGNRVAGML